MGRDSNLFISLLFFRMILIILILSSIGCGNPLGLSISAESSEKEIESFIFTAANNPAIPFNIHGSVSVNTIIIEAPYNVDISDLNPTINISGFRINPSSGEAQDFTNPVVYTVIAEDGSEFLYTVTVTINNKYRRSPSVIKDSFNQYWLFYAQADNATVLTDYADANTWHNAVDFDTYTIYYKRSSSMALAIIKAG